LFLFRGKKKPVNKTEPQAVIILDFDHWHVSFSSLFHIEADFKTLLDSISKQCKVNDIFIFGDFIGLEEKLAGFSAFTENIVDVRGDKKNAKDLLLIDRLYRCAAEYRDTDTTVIIISGSGSYTLAARYIKEQGIKVGVYSVRGALSKNLREAADWCYELPNDEFISMLYPLIIQNFVFISGKDIYPTVKTTVEYVSGYHNISPLLVEVAVIKMLEENYIYKKQTVIPREFTTIKTLAANWEKLIKDGLYDPEKDDTFYRA